MKPENNVLKKLSKMQTKHWVALLALVVIGAGLIALSNSLENAVGLWHELHLVLHELGILFVTILPMVFIYERMLRNSFLEEMAEKMTEVIQSQIPENMVNIRKSGLSDIEEKLRYDSVLRHIGKTANSKIRFLKIWIPSLELFHRALYDAIVQRNCQVEILLLNPCCTEAIEKRAKAYGYDMHRVQNHIMDNFKDLMDFYQKLPLEHREKLTVKLHRDFIGLSLIGVSDTFRVGLYLHGRVATEGTQLVAQTKGTFFYDELYKHFKHQFKHAEVFDLSNPDSLSKITNLLPDVHFTDTPVKKFGS
jgi:hypothetical protein